MTARVVTAKNFQKPSPAYYAFSTDFSSGVLRIATSDDQDNWSNWSEWTSLPNIEATKIASNPVVVSQLMNNSSSPYIMVFCQNNDGQVAMYSQELDFQPFPVSSNIPKTLDVANFSVDAVQAITLKNKTHVFVRSQTDAPVLFWLYFDKNFKLTTQKIGDDKTHLQFDPFVSINLFVNRLEVFIVSEDDYVKHLWQTSDTSFTGTWKKLGTDFSPKFNSAPVAHPMSDNFFNGVINLFVRGTDQRVHHISQTTCDKVKNPWGPCTWSTFDGLVDSVPADPSNGNPFTISNNIHLGIEVFVVGEKDGHLYHIWQKERDKVWNGWDDLGPLNPASAFKGQPGIMLDEHGWWQAFALNSSGLVSRYVQSPLKFSLSPEAVAYGKNVTVSWAIPSDEATHMDWIGLYQSGTSDKAYLDFSYVGGSQNPLKDPVPQGVLNFTVTVPQGAYQFRYLVNREFDAVLQTSLAVTGSSSEAEWEQLFRGIARGLGNLNTVNITQCVADGEKTLATFRAAFDAFEDRKIFEGLKLMSEALGDVKDALVECGETKIIDDLEKFIQDLASCTENACAKFLIDLAEELVILYEHIYEIYGDIQAATNCFKIDAYEQGGICIGRVTWACLTLE